MSEVVIELDRPRRGARRNSAKSYPLDAIRAAREAMARPQLGIRRSWENAKHCQWSWLLAAPRSMPLPRLCCRFFSLVIPAPETHPSSVPRTHQPTAATRIEAAENLGRFSAGRVRPVRPLRGGYPSPSAAVRRPCAGLSFVGTTVRGEGRNPPRPSLGSAALAPTNARDVRSWALGRVVEDRGGRWAGTGRTSDRDADRSSALPSRC